MKYWFLASPYSRYPGGIHAAFDVAVKARGLLVHAGVRVFSPIVHSHMVAHVCGIDPLDHNIWLQAERPFLHFAHGLIVLRADGWRDSVGMAYEITEFQFDRKPIVHMVPGTVPEELIGTTVS
jgi:hypothetical protein